jgi:hypothetical protein
MKDSSIPRPAPCSVPIVVAACRRPSAPQETKELHDASRSFSQIALPIGDFSDHMIE